MAPCINSLLDKSIRKIGQFFFIVMIVMQGKLKNHCFLNLLFPNFFDTVLQDENKFLLKYELINYIIGRSKWNIYIVFLFFQLIYLSFFFLQKWIVSDVLYVSHSMDRIHLVKIHSTQRYSAKNRVGLMWATIIILVGPSRKSVMAYFLPIIALK